MPRQMPLGSAQDPGRTYSAFASWARGKFLTKGQMGAHVKKQRALLKNATDFSKEPTFFTKVLRGHAFRHGVKSCGGVLGCVCWKRCWAEIGSNQKKSSPLGWVQLLLWLARPFGLLSVLPPPFPLEEVRPGADVERPVEREGCPATASAPARPRVDSTDGVVRLRDWLFM